MRGNLLHFVFVSHLICTEWCEGEKEDESGPTSFNIYPLPLDVSYHNWCVVLAILLQLI